MSNISSIELSAAQQAHTKKCTERVEQEIQQQGGSLGFDQYMQLVLHDPFVGYYHSQQQIFGENGDFYYGT